MFYKYEDNNDKWVRGNNIHLPNGKNLNPKAKNAKIDGWEWFDEPPQVYLDWVEQKNLESLILAQNSQI